MLWSPPANGTSGITGYNVYINGQRVSQNQTATTFADYLRSPYTEYIFEVAALNVLGIESETGYVTIIEMDTLPQWWQTFDSFPEMLKGFPYATTLCPSPTVDNASWRLQNIYRVNVSTNATLKECADYLEQQLPTLNYETYVTLAWLYNDMYESADPATMHQGAVGLIVAFPIARSIPYINVFNTGAWSTDLSLNIIPTNSFVNATDGSIVYPPQVSLTVSKEVIGIAPSAFGGITTISFNGGTTYDIVDGDIQIEAPASGPYTININGADILLPNCPTYNPPDNNIVLPSAVKYIPENYFADSTATTCSFSTFQDQTLLYMEKNVLPNGCTINVDGSSTKGHDLQVYLANFGGGTPTFLPMKYERYRYSARSFNNEYFNITQQPIVIYGGGFYINFVADYQLATSSDPNMNLLLWLPRNLRNIAGGTLTFPPSPGSFSLVSVRDIQTVRLFTTSNSWDVGPLLPVLFTNTPTRNSFTYTNVADFSTYRYLTEYILAYIYGGLQFKRTYLNTSPPNVETITWDITPLSIPTGPLKILNTSYITALPSFMAQADPTTFGPLTISPYVSFQRTDLPAGSTYYYGNCKWTNSRTAGQSRIAAFNPTFNGTITFMNGASDLYPFMCNDISNTLTTVNHYYTGWDENHRYETYNGYLRTSVPDNAFYGCMALTNFPVDVSGSIGATAFYGCSSLTNLTSSNVTDISSNAFDGCTSLATIDISSNAPLSIASNAFANCNALQSVSIATTSTSSPIFSFSLIAFTNLVTINLSLPQVSLVGNQFSGCTALQNANISKITSATGTDIFSGCTNLRTVKLVFAPGVTGSFFSSGFNTLSSLISVDISCDAITFPQTSFANCPALTSVKIKNLGTSLSSSSFAQSTLLQTLSITYDPSGSVQTFAPILTNRTDLTTLGILGPATISATNFLSGSTSALQNLSMSSLPTNNFGITPYAGFPALKTLILACYDPSSSVTPYLFSNSTAMTSASISGVLDISDGAFFGCTGLANLSLAEGLETIGDFAFANTGVSGEIVIPSTLITPGLCYFLGCPNIKKLTYNCDVVYFADPTQITSDIWKIMNNPDNQTFDISGVTTLTTGFDPSLNFSYISNGVTTQINPYSLSQHMDQTKFQSRIDSLNTVLGHMQNVYRDISNEQISLLMFKLQSLGAIFVNTYGPAPNMETFVGWNSQLNRFVDASTNVITDTVNPGNLTAVEVAFQQLILINNQLIKVSADGNTTLVPNTIPLPSQFSFTQPRLNISQIVGTNTVGIVNDRLCVTWTGATTITFSDNTYIDVSGLVILDFSDNFSDNYAQIMKWMYNNYVTISKYNGVDFLFDNTQTTIQSLTYKSGSSITIQSSLVHIYEDGMSCLQNVNVNIQADILYLYNSACNLCYNTVFNIEISNLHPSGGIFTGTGVFINSSAITINSNKFLTNKPVIRMVDMGQNVLTDISSIILNATLIDAADTFNVSHSTYIRENSPGLTGGLAIIQFQQLSTLQIYVLVQQPEDWFWCYRAKPYEPPNNTSFGFENTPYINSPGNDLTEYFTNPDENTRGDLYYAGKPVLPAPPWIQGIPGSQTSTDMVFKYINADAGDPVANQMGLASSFFPDSFSYMGCNFTRQIPLNGTTTNQQTAAFNYMQNPSGVTLYALKTNNNQAILDIKNSIGLNNVWVALLNVFLFIAEIIAAIAITYITAGLASPLVVAALTATLGVSAAVVGIIATNYITTESVTLKGSVTILILSLLLSVIPLGISIRATMLKTSRIAKLVKATSVTVAKDAIKFSKVNPLLGRVGKALKNSQVQITRQARRRNLLLSSEVPTGSAAVDGGGTGGGGTGGGTGGGGTGGGTGENTTAAAVGENTVESEAVRNPTQNFDVKTTPPKPRIVKTFSGRKLDQGDLVTVTDVEMQSIFDQAALVQRQVETQAAQQTNKVAVSGAKTGLNLKNLRKLADLAVVKSQRKTVANMVKTLETNAVNAVSNNPPGLPAKKVPPNKVTRRVIRFDPDALIELRPHATIDISFNTIIDISTYYQYIYEILQDDTSSADYFIELLNIYSIYDANLVNQSNITLSQLAAYQTITEQDLMASTGILGGQAIIASPLLSAAQSAANANIPPFIFPLQTAARYPDGVAQYSLLYYLLQGNNYTYPNTVKDFTGYPCSVISNASPLHLVDNYLWNGTYSSVGTTPQNAETNQNNQVDYTSVLLSARIIENSTNYSTQLSTYLGRRSVAFDISNELVPNTVYCGATDLTIILPPTVTNIPAGSFCSPSDYSDGNSPFSIQNLYINPSVTTIGAYAFSNAAVTNLYYPSNATIQEGAFANAGLKNAVAYDLSDSAVTYTGVDTLNISLTQNTKIFHFGDTFVFQDISSADLSSGTIATETKFVVVECYSAEDLSNNMGTQMYANINASWALKLTNVSNVSLTTDFRINDDPYFGFNISNPTGPITLNYPLPTYTQNGQTLTTSGNTTNRSYNGFVSFTNSPTIRSNYPGYNGPENYSYTFNTTFSNTSVFTFPFAKSVTVGKGYGTVRSNVRQVPMIDSIQSTSIGNYAFAGNTLITNFTFSKKCSGIGHHAFENTTQLTKLILPDGITTIGDNAFAGSGLKQIMIPSNLTSVGSNIFQDVSSLQLIVYYIPPAFVQLAEQLPMGSNIITTSQQIVDAIILMLQDIPSRPAVLLVSIPSSPQDVTAVAEDGQVTVSWGSILDLDPTLQGYTLVYGISGEGPTVINNASNPTIIRNLRNRSEYTITIYATNILGEDGAASDPICATPIPSAPTSYTNLLQIDGVQETQVNYVMWAFDLLATEDSVNMWVQTDSISQHSICNFFSHPENTKITTFRDVSGVSTDASGSLIFDLGLNNTSLIPNLTVTDLRPSSRYYLITELGSDHTLSIGIESYTGRNIPLTLVKMGSQINPATGFISSSDTSLQSFTIQEGLVQHGESITIRNQATPQINVIPNDPDATVDICGCTALLDGIYMVTVVITAADGVTTAEYTVDCNILLNTISESTVAAIQELNTSNPVTMTNVIDAIGADITANTSEKSTVLTNFIQHIQSIDQPTTISVLAGLSLQLSTPSLKAIVNSELQHAGIHPSSAYAIQNDMIPALMSSIDNQYKVYNYTPSSLSLILPDPSSKTIVMDMTKDNLMMSLIPNVVYTMSAMYNNQQSKNNYNVVYNKTDEGRFLIVNGTQQDLNSTIVFSFTNSPKRGIQLKAFGSPIAAVYVIPSPPIHSLKILPASVRLRIGNSGTLNTRITPSHGTNPLIWSSSSSCVSVGASGAIRAVSKGMATITAVADDGSISATAQIEVIPN